MLQPTKTKYRKHQRGKRRGAPVAGSKLQYGEFGLKSLDAGWLTARSIEAARRAIVHYVSRSGQIYIRVFPDKSVSSRPAETRMGGGKGAVDHWVAVVKRGRMLIEISGVPEDVARAALRRAAHKLPMSTQIISRDMEL
jgi:large subunit ribosomal protein L16